jgi:cystathionine beta-lyase/cystathionine gamma-synthase
MTHAPVAAAALKKAGISKKLIRLSIGIESADDLIADLVNALANAQPKLAVIGIGQARSISR